MSGRSTRFETYGGTATRANRIPFQSLVEPAHAPPSLEAEPAGRDVHFEHLEHAKLHLDLVAFAPAFGPGSRPRRWRHLGVHLGENLRSQGFDGREVLLRAGRADAKKQGDNAEVPHVAEVESRCATLKLSQPARVAAGRVESKEQRAVDVMSGA